MVRFSDKRWKTLVLGGSFLTLALMPYPGMSARAQAPGASTDTEPAAEPAETETDADSGAADSTDSTEAAETADVPRFTCQMHNGQYTVMYSPASEPTQAYPWAVPGDMGSNWPAQRRCSEISGRLESYRPDGLLELQTGVENGYNTVCVTTESISNCRIVFTVPEGQDPVITRDQVFENLTLADAGEQTQGVSTFTGGDSDVLGQIGEILGTTPSTSSPSVISTGINLKPFLAPDDGGTGTQLTRGASTGRSLNPDNFR